MGKDTSRTQSLTRAASSKAAQVQKSLDAAELKQEVHLACKPKAGQPTKFTQEKWERILEAVATYQDLFTICDEPDMPAVSTVYRWMRDNPELKDDMRGAWEMFSFIARSVNQNILSGGKLSSGDVRRDIEKAADNRWHISKTNRRDFGDKTLVQIETVEPFVLEGWMLPGHTQQVIDVKPDEGDES